MKSLLMVVLLIISLTAEPVNGIQCYQCTYPYDLGCLSAHINDSLQVIECSTACQESVILQSNNNDNVFTFSRGCANNDSIDCCQNQNSNRRCTTVCDNNDLCNNASHSPSSPINTLSRCPAPVQEGNIPCNSCVYSQGQDRACLDDPLSAKVNIVQCPTATHECTVKSIRYMADRTTAWSYERGCHVKGSQAYGVTEDSIYVTWICHCDTPYCNDNIVDGMQEECHPTGGEGGGVGGGGTNLSNVAQLVAMVIISLMGVMSSSRRYLD